MAKEPRLPQHIVCVVYPESFDIEIFKQICWKEDFWFAYILHNKDRDEFGNFKKPHYHIFIDFQSVQVRESTAERLGIKPNQWQRCRNPYGYLKYMIHEE